jgi:serine/threonine protein kinase
MRAGLVWTRFYAAIKRNLLSIHRRRFEFLGDIIGLGGFFEVRRYEIPRGDTAAFQIMPSRKMLEPGTIVAIKKITPRDDDTGLERSVLRELTNEVIVLSRPSLQAHENIVTMHSLVWEDRGSDVALWPSIVLEYCPATLADLQSHGLKPLEALLKGQVLQQIGMGLDALHEEAFIHGDLKSENVLIQISEGGIIIPKLSDFGSSVLFWESEELVRIGGTDPWRAPEVSLP